ncbi:MAG: hypothetical protein M0Q51_06455 [Bacteroidales bacterium]|nr:hypothetical protein [Bacteroidales bacterium]
MEQDSCGTLCSFIFPFPPKSTTYLLYEKRVLLSLLAIDIAKENDRNPCIRISDPVLVAQKFHFNPARQMPK